LNFRNRARFANIAHLRFRFSRRSVSVRVSDPLDAIAYRNAATFAAIVIDVLRRHQPNTGVTKGGTTHLLSVQMSSVQSCQARDLRARHPNCQSLYHTPYPIRRRCQPLSHTKSEKLKLLNRVKRVRGQIEAVERAIEEEKGCSTVLHLIVAARGAMNSLMTEVIEDHIRLHVVDPVRDAERSRGAEELIEAVQAYLK
jgi:FrmR/RcnR family transcriptional regulator, repressor of rcnA expression